MLNLRPAHSSDSAGIAEVNVASWRAAYRGIICDQGLAELSVPERTEVWRGRLEEPGTTVLVCEDSDRIAGFASLLPCGDDDKDPSRCGEIVAIYLHPDYWRRGLGRALLQRAEELLRVKGYEEIVIWVLAENRQARAFYERFGYRPDGTEKADHMHCTDVVKVRYAKKPERGQPPESGSTR